MHGRLVAILVVMILVLPLLYTVTTYRIQRVILAFAENIISDYYPAPKPRTLLLQYEGSEPIRVDDVELFGYMVIYFDHEFVGTVLLDQLRARRTVVMDLSSAIEKSRERYEVEKEYLYSVIRGTVKLPTLGITVFLFDENGYMYIDSWTLSAFKYNLIVKQLDLKSAIEDALRNPYRFVEEGIVVVIDPKILSKRLTTKIDLEAWFKHIDQVMGVDRKNIGFALQQYETGDVKTASWCGDFCRDTYWVELASTYDNPPSWFTNRVILRNTDYPDFYKNEAWKEIAGRFSQATNYAKDRYSLQQAFSKFLNDVDGIKWYCQIFYNVKIGNYTAYVDTHPIDFVRECGAIPSGINVEWNNTFPYLPPTLLEVYKPYIVFYESQYNYQVSLIMMHVEFGYVKKGITLFGKLVLSQEYLSQLDVIIYDTFNKNILDQIGAIGGGFIIPSTYLYWGEEILIVFYPRTRTLGNREYWSFIPVMIFYPRLTEGEDLLDAVRVRFNPLIIRCSCASSSEINTTCDLTSYYCSRLLNRSIYDILRNLSYAEYMFVNITPACNISEEEPILVDRTSSLRLTIEDGAIVFYIVKTFIDVLFDAFSGEYNLATTLLKYFITSIGYADLTMNLGVRRFELYMLRNFANCNYVALEIHKNFHYSAMFRVLNATIYEVPLVGYYIIDPLPHQPPCDNPVAC